MRVTRIRQLFLIPACLFLVLAFRAEQKTASSPLGSLSSKTGLLIRDDVTVKLIQTSSGDLAHDYVSQIALWDRQQYTPGFDRAAEWVAGKAKEFGLDEVEIERYPSDGKVEYFGNPTQRTWTVKKAELWMTQPFEIRLTSYAELPMSLARNSASADVEAEVVDVGAGVSEDDYKQDVKGKIVLATGNPFVVARQAVDKRGAVGLVTSWSVPEFDNLNRLPGDFPDQIGWGGFAAPGEKEAGRFGFLISSRRHQELRTLLHQGKSMKMRAVVDAEFSAGSICMVSGLIRGAVYPAEEIIFTAHLDHYKPGANDNASGSAAILEIARTLSQLIETGQLPHPLRTIRFLWVPEYSGSWAWFSRHLDDPVKRIANLNYDMVGENLKLTNAVLAMMYTPDFNPSYLNGVMESILDFMNRFNDERYPPQKDFQIISIGGSRDRLQGRMVPYMTGTDHEVFNNAGIPGTGPLAWPDFFYHSSEDTPAKVDPTELHRVVFAGLAAALTMGYADDQNAQDLARITLLYGQKRIALSESEAVAALLSSSKEGFTENDFLAMNLIRHVYHREREAVRSSGTFSRKAETGKSIERLALMLDDDEKVSRKNVEEIASLRAKELGVERTVVQLSEEERRASRMIPAREKGMELYNINYAVRKAGKDAPVKEVQAMIVQALGRLQEKGISALRLMSMPDAASHYADGKRSILDIRNAVAADYGLLPVDALILYFKVFEQAGLMKIVEKGS
jgi:hypothetical protein